MERIGTILSVALLMGSAHANASERPAAWDMNLDELKARGLGQRRTYVVSSTADELRNPTAPHTGGDNSEVIFVNFDGANLGLGAAGDDARTDRTALEELVGPFAPYGDGAKRAATLQAVRDDWAAYDVLVVETRPMSGNYTMNMTGPTTPYESHVLGVALLDCGGQSPNNVTFAFHSANDSHSASTHATTVSQEVAHSFGLEHVNNPADIMNPTNAGGDPSFLDMCIDIVPHPIYGIVCTAQHSAQCGSSSQQNSHAELLERLGPAVVDTEAPTVSILFPSNGEMFDVDTSVSVGIEATDDRGVAAVEVFVDGESRGTKAAAPWSFDVLDLPAGEHDVYATATDLAGNEGLSNVVSFSVVDDMPNEDSWGTSGEPTDDTGDTPWGPGEGTGGAGALPGGFGGRRASVEGCACGVSGGNTSGAAASLLLLVWLGRRRRAQDFT